MAAVAHNPAFAKKVGISQSVGKHFMAKDKGRKFGGGGSTSGAEERPVGTRQSPEMIKFNKEQEAKRAAEAEATRKSMKDAEASQKAKLDQQAQEEASQQAQQKATNKAYEQAKQTYKKGGNVDKEMKAANIFAKAGEKKLAAHERREAAGKEKDTPAIAKKEESVLKKAKAPKDVQEYEKAEHKSMGMKKGGGVKKYAKQTKRGGSSARMARPDRGVDPAAMAALMGGAGPAAPMSGVPGMAHGGGIHHHHHYYAGGGIEQMNKAKTKRIRGKARVR
jgi:glucan-binding YG repeat protein